MRLIDIAQIVVSITIIVLILLQERSSGSGAIFGGSSGGGFHQKRRGVEKFLFYGTITFVAIFGILAVLNLFLSN